MVSWVSCVVYLSVLKTSFAFFVTIAQLLMHGPSCWESFSLDLPLEKTKQKNEHFYKAFGEHL